MYVCLRPSRWPKAAACLLDFAGLAVSSRSTAAARPAAGRLARSQQHDCWRAAAWLLAASRVAGWKVMAMAAARMQAEAVRLATGRNAS